MRILYRLAVLSLIVLPLSFYAPHLLQACGNYYVDPLLFQRANRVGLQTVTFNATRIAELECTEALITQMLAEEDTTLSLFLESATDAVASEALDVPTDETIDWGQISDLQLDLERIRTELREQWEVPSELINNLYATVNLSSAQNIDYLNLLALALFDYAQLVRQSYALPGHTQVPSLISDPFCEGDVILDRTLWHYFQAILMSRDGGTQAQVDALKALDDFAIQMACLGTQQLFDLDVAMSVAWYRLQSELEDNGLSFLELEAASTILQPRLLLYDANKHFGSESPGYLWLTSQTEIREASVKNALWPLDQRLWVYDRRTAMLVGLDTTCSDGGVGHDCINLSVLLESLVNPVHLGFGECGMLEMTEAGIRDVQGTPGYTCTPGLCGTPLDGMIPETILGASFQQTWQANGALFNLPGGGLGVTPFGVSLNEARGAVCGDSRLGSGDDSGDSGNVCGVTGGGLGGRNPAVACVVEQRQQRSTTAINTSCISRINDVCSQLNPFESMGVVDMRGVPACQRITPGNTTPSDPYYNEVNDIHTKAEELHDVLNGNEAAKDEVNDTVENGTRGARPTEENYQQALLELLTLQDTLFLIRTNPKNPFEKIEYAGVTNRINGDITISVAAWYQYTEQEKYDLLLHEFIHALLAHMRGTDTLRMDLTKEKEHKIIEELGQNWRPPYRLCDPDGGECGNGCNGLSQQVSEILACTASENDQGPPRDPLAPIIYPSPDDLSGDIGLLTCVMTQEDTTLASVVASKVCAAVQCASPNAGYSIGTGNCCQAGGVTESTQDSGRSDRICEIVRCAGDVAASPEGLGGDLSMCGCGGSFVSTRPEPSPPVDLDPFTIPPVIPDEGGIGTPFDDDPPF